MTEKNYNPEQKKARAEAKTSKVEKMFKDQAEVKQKEKVASHEKKIGEKINGKETETKEIPEKISENEKKVSKDVKKEKPKKEKAIVRGVGLPISSKHSFAISKFIKGKEIEKAISELQEILAHKKALPMKGEIPHRRGRGMMSGRYPKKAIDYFIKLLKSLNSNAISNEISIPVIYEASANFASRPYGKFGRVRKKRTNVTIVAIPKEKIKKFKEKK